MLAIPGAAKAAGAKVLTGTRPARKPLPGTKRRLVVMAVALVALVALGVLISASQVTNAELIRWGVRTLSRGQRRRRFPNLRRRLR